MDFTVTVSNAFGISPFDVLKQDKDEVIMLINYYIEKGDAEDGSKTDAVSPGQRSKGKNERIRVNDKTASGGWF